MADDDRLARRFEAYRPRLRAVAYRMLGSPAEADDAVQEAWLRLARSDARSIDNLGGWLTTVVSRVCLDMLRARAGRARDRQEVSLVDRLPAPVASGAVGGLGVGGIEPALGPDPGEEAELAESVGSALLVVLDRLGPDERVAFVLHDLFGVSFADIAPIVRRSPVAAKKLASRARRRVRGDAAHPGALTPADLTTHRRVVESFLAAARGGDVGALLVLLAPDVVRRADVAALPVGGAVELRGAWAVVEETLTSVRRARLAAVALVDGRPGIVVAAGGRLAVALRLTVDAHANTVTHIDVVADPRRLAALHVAVPGDGGGGGDGDSDGADARGRKWLLSNQSRPRGSRGNAEAGVG